MTARSVQCVFSLLLVAHVAVAQDNSELRPGVKVRLEAPGFVASRFEGTVLSRTNDSLVVGSPATSPLRLPVSGITRIEISRGTSRAEGAKAGMKWGVPILTVFGLIVAPSIDECPSCTKLSSGEKVSLVGVFALSGALYGAGIGALIGKERWEQFALPGRTSFNVRPATGRLDVGFDFRF